MNAMANTTRIPWRNLFAQINVASISIANYVSHPPPPPPSLESCHNVLAFIVPVLLSLLQIKYQGNKISPFETHPISMEISVASLLFYCLGYHAKSRWPTYALVVSRGMVVFGSLSVVSLASILFPDSFGPVLYALFVLFSATELVKLFKWVHRKIMGMLLSQLTTAAFSN
ncbi:hypothetical protein RHSIM_Rhsim07G0111400 [Rhododendron simsii]|uniref:Uncharacterized protein n=1 Tax=Rhododendron simsii TaxID=118357 RepID=A0A834GSQ2_RHOSS|nr:hypothetical protein RHSIM_Rhsim07G0111400 [Rhododendron simsii]